MASRQPTVGGRHRSTFLKKRAMSRAFDEVGVRRVTAAIMVVEIGDVTRFPDARHLCSWVGLTPSHRESDTKVHRGHITKQGSTLVRWAAIEAVARYHGGAALASIGARVPAHPNLVTRKRRCASS